MAAPASTPLPQPPADAARGTVPHLRWLVCALLFFATTVNYIDRQVLGILKPTLAAELGWTEQEYGGIVFAFQLAYAASLPLAGRLMDWLGTRAGYALAVAAWSLAAMGHALARSAVQFSIARFALGIGEASNFPAAVRTVADWFPARERALATGIFNSGSNIGAVIAPLMVPWLTLRYGWRGAFVVTGAFGFVWLAAWWMLYRHPREHRWLGESERRLIEDGRANEAVSVKVPWSTLLSSRPAWAFFLAKFLTDPVWWFLLYWLPSYLGKQHGIDLTRLGPPLVTIYLAADIGSVGGGWLPAWLARRGASLGSARRWSLLVCALASATGALTYLAGDNLWLAVALVSVAAAGHQGWSANVFTLPSDYFERGAVGTVVGWGGMGGAVGGMLAALLVGWWLDRSGQAYGPVFAVAGSLYLVAWLLVRVLAPTPRERPA